MVTNIDSDRNFPWWSQDGLYGPFVDHSYPGIEDVDPTVADAYAIGASSVIVVFSVPMILTELQVEANYILTPDPGSTARTVTNAVAHSSGIFVILTLSGTLTTGTDNYNVRVENISSQILGREPVNPFDNADFSGLDFGDTGPPGPDPEVAMPYLTINSFTVPIAVDSPRMDLDDVGGDSTTFDGSVNVDIRDELRKWKLETVPIVYETAYAIEGLIKGRGHAWTFEDSGASNAWQYSNKGLAATTITGATRTTSQSRFGSASLQLDNAESVVWAMGLSATPGWTAMVHRRVGGTWAHYLETSTGLYYADGVAAAQQTWFTVSSGNFTLANSSGATVYFDDLVVLPFAVTATMARDFGLRSTAWPSYAPDVEISGTIVNDALLRGIGRNVRWDGKTFVSNGTYRNNAARLSFELWQQPE